MAITDLNGSRRMAGLSTDIKPATSTLYGDRFYEYDTGKWWLYLVGGWVPEWSEAASSPASGGVDQGTALREIAVFLSQILRELRGIRQMTELVNEMSVNDLEAGDLVPA